MGDPPEDIDHIDSPRKSSVIVGEDGRLSLRYDPLAIDNGCCYLGRAAVEPEDFRGQSQIFDRSWAIRRTVGVGLIEAAGIAAAGGVGWLTGLGAPAGLLMYAFVRGIMLKRWGRG